MNGPDASGIHRLKVDELVEEYRRRGYQVSTDSTLFPKFLKGHNPDFIAISEKDNVAVEVKVRSARHGELGVHGLAHAIENEPNWRLDLVVVETPVAKSAPLPTQDILRRIREAKGLASSHPTAALLLVWTAIEATLRTLLRDAEATPNMSSVLMIKTATSLGLLSRESTDTLLTASRLKNQVSHGIVYDEDKIASGHLSLLIQTAEKMLAEVSPNESQEDLEITSDEMTDWFFENYEDPAEYVPYETSEGGYIYYNGGPYDPREVLSENFPDVDEAVLSRALSRITPRGHDWVKKGQYP